MQEQRCLVLCEDLIFTEIPMGVGAGLQFSFPAWFCNNSKHAYYPCSSWKGQAESWGRSPESGFLFETQSFVSQLQILTMFSLPGGTEALSETGSSGSNSQEQYPLSFKCFLHYLKIILKYA